MARIDLHKTVETVCFSDEPEARSFEVRFDDESMKGMRSAVEGMRDALEELQKLGDAQDPEKTAEVYRTFIVAVAGQECYEEALSLIDMKGEGAAKCNYMMVTVVNALADMVLSHLDFARSRRLAHYLGDGREAI